MKKNAHKSVAVIILNWNGFNDTCECVKSALKSDYGNFKVFVVDNGSGHDEAARLQKKFGAKIKVIKSKKNLGYTGGNNLGIKSLEGKKYDYFLILNNDTVVDSKLILNLVRSIEKDQKIAVANPIVFQYYHKKLLENAGLKSNLWHGAVTPIDQGEKKVIHRRSPDILSGTCFLFRASALKDIKFLFDEEYFCYYDDPDLSIRLKRAGYKIVISYNARLWHKISAITKTISGFAEFQTIKNRFLMEKKHALLAQKIVFLLVNLFFYFPFRIIRIAVFKKEGNLHYFLRGFWAGLKILFGGQNDQYS